MTAGSLLRLPVFLSCSFVFFFVVDVAAVDISQLSKTGKTGYILTIPGPDAVFAEKIVFINL